MIRNAFRPCVLLATGFALFNGNAPGRADPGPTLRLNPPNDPRAAFEIVGLDPADAAELARLVPVLRPDQWSGLLAVSTVPDNARRAGSLPTILGTYRVDAGILRFLPRFPLEPGLVYRASLDVSRLPSARRVAGRGLIVAEFVLPRKSALPTTQVSAVFPTRDTLPENLLKFYLQFSAPMSRGAAYEHIHLRDAEGKNLDLPFLELAEELWDPGGVRLTILFDPGRIKTGLKPREELGPVLRQGGTYTLVIDRSWPDAAGQPLESEFRKTFRVGPPDHSAPNPQAWVMQTPGAGTRDALLLSFPEPLDRAMLARVLTIYDGEGHPVPGVIAIEDEETRWRFTPDRPWAAGGYSISVSMDLEDLAGNSVGRLFEVDVFDTVERRPKAETMALPFRIEARGSIGR
jgi:hypothetical protein